jgi:hypothetical protein
MEFPQVIVYADIGEVRLETREAKCQRLLAEGWVLLGVYPLTSLGDTTEKRAKRKPKQPQESRSAGQEPEGQRPGADGTGQRYVRRLVGYVLGRSRERET